ASTRDFLDMLHLLPPFHRPARPLPGGCSRVAVVWRRSYEASTQLRAPVAGIVTAGSLGASSYPEAQTAAGGRDEPVQRGDPWPMSVRRVVLADDDLLLREGLSS